jgi:prepilin-type N-terminal cleavage/methylation domain-containing protein
VSRSSRGYTLLEVVFSIAIFGIFLFTLTALMTEMRLNEQTYVIDYMKHPQVIAVLARIRKDVLDAFGADPYPSSFKEAPTAGNPAPKEYFQSPTTLIVTSVQTTGFIQTIVWDFSTPGEARRRAYNIGALASNWVALGVPAFTVESFEIPGRPYSVRLKALDGRKQLAIDQILQPRAH